MARFAASDLMVTYGDLGDGVHMGQPVRVETATQTKRLAEEFLRRHRREDRAAGPLPPRLREVLTEIDRSGTYVHTTRELEFGARVAWRNASRCIGRLYWQSLRVRDRRHLAGADAVAAECVSHLREATNGGRIRPLITVFAPSTPWSNGPRVINDQLIRYAGDPGNTALTGHLTTLGWRPTGDPYEVLPLAVREPEGRVLLYGLPDDAVLEVPLRHPDYAWFADLRLRWYAVPALSAMCLEIGGVHYPCAPFNGWYLGTEIGARTLADPDRYDLLPEVAARLGLDVTDERSLWRDHAVIELNVAVLHSYAAAGVTVADHHTESRRFLTHLHREERAGRVCPADWSWIVPPISGSTTPVFHRYYDQADLSPRFATHTS